MSLDPLEMLLRAFHLPTMAAIYGQSLAQAENQNWGYKRFLLHLCESEAQDRRERRAARLIKTSGLPDGKNLGNLEENVLPPKIKRLLPTLLEGGFVDRAENVLAFGLPGRGKTHFLAALGRELILRHRYPVLFTPTFKLVQQLLAAKKELRLEAFLKKLDKFAVVILDDIGYVQQDREEMEVLFTFLAERYERGSVMLTSNLPAPTICGVAVVADIVRSLLLAMFQVLPALIVIDVVAPLVSPLPFMVQSRSSVTAPLTVLITPPAVLSVPFPWMVPPLQPKVDAPPVVNDRLPFP